MAYLLEVPCPDEDVAGIWQEVHDGAVAALPTWARDRYGFGGPHPLTPSRRTEIRQALGVLDAVFLAEPGVLNYRREAGNQRLLAAHYDGSRSQPGGDGQRKGQPMVWARRTAGTRRPA